MSYINLIGVELEGGWGRNEAPPFSDGTILIDDQSLRNPLVHHKTGERLWHYGEAVSKPLPLDDAAAWLLSHYPQGWDEWCSIHFHASLKHLKYYALLASQAYWDFFLKDMEAWGKEERIGADHIFWHRWAGRNKYCTRAFRPLSQIMRTTKGGPAERYLRRTMLNFPFAMHGTIENRLFPVFDDPRISDSGLRRWVKGMEDFIEAHVGRRVPDIRAEISLRDLGLINEAKKMIQI